MVTNDDELAENLEMKGWRQLRSTVRQELVAMRSKKLRVLEQASNAASKEIERFNKCVAAYRRILDLRSRIRPVIVRERRTRVKTDPIVGGQGHAIVIPTEVYYEDVEYFDWGSYNNYTKQLTTLRRAMIVTLEKQLAIAKKSPELGIDVQEINDLLFTTRSLAP